MSDIKLSEKNIYDIIHYLTNKFDVVNVDRNNPRYEKKLKFFLINILDSYRNEFYKYTVNDLEPYMYLLELTESSKPYLLNSDTSLEFYNLNPIYVLLEVHTRTIQTNSSILHKELVLKLGVDEFEFKHNLYDLYSRFLSENK